MSRGAAPSELNDGLRWSLLGHFVLALFVILKGTAFQGKPLRYVPTLKVDLVALPDQLKNQKVHPTLDQSKSDIHKILDAAETSANRIKTSSPVKDVAQQNEMILNARKVQTEKKIEKRNKRALDRIKALAKIQNSSDDPIPEKTAPAPKAVLIKGNILSPGSSLSGDAREASEANYLEILRDRLQENWTLPTWVARQSLSAQIQVFINSRGKLNGFKFVKPSGNPNLTMRSKEPFTTVNPSLSLQKNLLPFLSLMEF